MNDFYSLPSIPYLYRAVILAAVQAVVGFVIVYVLLVTLNLGFSTVNQGFFARFQDQTQNTIQYTLSHPAVCQKAKNDQSEFEKKQCEGFNAKLLIGWVMILIPVFLVYFAVSFYTSRIKKIYYSGARSIEKNPSLGRAVVTSPALIHTDMFAKIYCLKAVSVEMADKTQEVVYFPYYAMTPSPGEKVNVFPLGKFSGEDRLTGQVYTPGVTVYKGG